MVTTGGGTRSPFKLNSNQGYGMIEVMSFWEHREKYPDLYVTEEENIKFNYDNKKRIKAL